MPATERRGSGRVGGCVCSAQRAQQLKVVNSFSDLLSPPADRARLRTDWTLREEPPEGENTISKHLLEKSEAICCLLCPSLFGNRKAECCWQGESSRQCHGSTPPPGLKQPHAIGSEGFRSDAVPGQYGFRRGAEATVDVQLGEGLP
ncbi:hypothetical protein NQZ68_028238 [Dissostichus eleginoides]|nr:hypothetical protein NQZ68_028238 [Dissostichus eleginoides]